MEKVFINKKGEIIKQANIVNGSVLKLIGNSIELDERFTLGSFFMMVKQYPDLINISEIIEPLLEIVAKTGSIAIKSDELDSLLFYKTIEIKGYPGSPSLTFYNTLKGLFDKETKDLKFYHLETLLNHKLELGKLKHVVFGDREDVFQYRTFYTLFEFVEGISWELSFNFNPIQCSIRR